MKKEKKEGPLSIQKAAIYVRVSTAEQAKEGFSLAAQEEALKNYAKTLGYGIYKVYKDEQSAKDMKHRPALQQLLKEAEQRKFDAIFVYKLDRFSRSLKDLILTIEKLKEMNIDFISLQDKIETASASGKLMFHIISAFAEFERDIISERTRFGMTEKAKEGGIVTKAPLGYKIVNGKLYAENKETVQKIFDEFLNTNKSIAKIAKENNLTTSGLIKLLKNRTYLGEIKFKGSYKGSHEAIISSEIFKKTQEKLKEISFQRQLKKNYNFLKNIFLGNFTSLMNFSHLITKKEIVVEKKPLEKGEIKEEIAKIFREEGFADSEIFEKKEEKAICAFSKERKIFVFFSCDAEKAIDLIKKGYEVRIPSKGFLFSFRIF